MKVLLVNGSSRKNGCTNAALCEVEYALNEEGIETEQFFIGNEALPDCIACRKCREIGCCIFHDIVNEFVERPNPLMVLFLVLRFILRIRAADF